MNEKPEVEIVATFREELPGIAGWGLLSREKQDDLRKHTEQLQQYRQMRRLGELGELVELTQVQHLLEHEEMRMLDYLRVIYPDHTERTIYRKRKVYQELSTKVPNSILQRISGLADETLAKFRRISIAELGEIRNALLAMPRLPVNTDKDPERFLQDVENTIIQERKGRRQKGNKNEDNVDTETVATNSLNDHLLSTHLSTTADKRQWLRRVLGYVMEAHAIQGNICASRMPIPDGVLPRRGRPRGRKKKVNETA